MTASKKKGSKPRGSATATKIQNREKRQETAGKRQLMSVIWFAVAVFAVTMVISLIGLLIYKRICSKHEKQ